MPRSEYADWTEEQDVCNKELHEDKCRLQHFSGVALMDQILRSLCKGADFTPAHRLAVRDMTPHDDSLGRAVMKLNTLGDKQLPKMGYLAICCCQTPEPKKAVVAEKIQDALHRRLAAEIREGRLKVRSTSLALAGAPPSVDLSHRPTLREELALKTQMTSKLP
jgi:hypothetical protein